MEDKRISNAVIQRLPRYYRYLSDLLDVGTERISSKDLSNMMKVTASQIRQDLNNFGGFGQQGYGYNVKFLHSEIGRILDIDKLHKMIVIGAGNLGCALSKYDNFSKRGFVISALFDVSDRVIGQRIGDVYVHDMAELEDFIKSEGIEIAALTVPKSEAQHIADRLVDSGISAIWNFVHMDLSVPEHVVVENVHLSDYLMRLSYRISNKSDK